MSSRLGRIDVVKVALGTGGRRRLVFGGGEDDHSTVVVVLIAATAERPRAQGALAEPARVGVCV